MTDLGDLVPTAFDVRGASFVETLRRVAPEHVPDVLRDGRPLPAELQQHVVHGTTVLAVKYAGGVVVAGDRRATTGNLIARGDMRKVFRTDGWSAIAIAGAAGPAIELARVFAIELEHYEKVEGHPLSLDGKANKLAGMVRANLGLAMQGLVVVPLFAGVEAGTGEGRIFEYDPTGGRYAAHDHAASGSGSLIARGALKRAVDPRADRGAAVTTAVAALFDAAEDDSATGGPDLVRRIYPIVAVIDALGYRELPSEEVAEVVAGIVEERTERARRHDTDQPQA